MGMSVGNKDDGGGGVMVEMNTTPLIDVMLVLLVMIIMTVPPQTHAVNMNMPVNSNNAPPPVPPEIIRITIDFDGTIDWNGEVLATKADLESRLAEASRRAEQPEIHVRPNKLVPYKSVAMVMAAAQRNGLTKIGIVGNEQFMN